MLLQLLQQLFHGQRKGDEVTPGAVAMPGHMRLLVEYGNISFLFVFALHGHEHHAGQTRRSAQQLDRRNILSVDPLKPIASPHIIGVAQGWKLGIGQMCSTISTNRQPALFTQHLAIGVLFAAQPILMQ